MQMSIGFKNALLASKRSYIRYISHELRTPLNTAYLGLNHLQGTYSTSFFESQNPFFFSSTTFRFCVNLTICRSCIAVCAAFCFCIKPSISQSCIAACTVSFYVVADKQVNYMDEYNDMSAVY